MPRDIGEGRSASPQPEGLVVQQDNVMGRRSVDHRPDLAVARRKSVLPAARRLHQPNASIGRRRAGTHPRGASAPPPLPSTPDTPPEAAATRSSMPASLTMP